MQAVDREVGRCVEVGAEAEAAVEVHQGVEVALAIGDEVVQGEVAQEVVDSALAEVEVIRILQDQQGVGAEHRCKVGVSARESMY